jgi:hypothetical protein
MACTLSTSFMLYEDVLCYDNNNKQISLNRFPFRHLTL